VAPDPSDDERSNLGAVQISPRYDASPPICFDGDPAAVATPLLRQRERLAQALSALGPEQWTAQSRCAEWRVQDVVAHLTGTNQFWLASFTAAMAGTPTRFLAGFDPKATPAAMVSAVRDERPADVLAHYTDTAVALAALVETITADGWRSIAESPAGHVSLSAAAHHALWDGWVHERDILLPLDVEPPEEPDEIVASLRAAVALSPALALQTSPARTGTIVVDVTDPDAGITVIVDGDVRVTECSPGEALRDALVLTGDAVDVLEALSVRVPWRQAIPDEHAWMLAGLTDVFETVAG